MQSVSRRLFLGLSTGALLALTGCSLFSARGPKGGSPEAWAAISNGAPVRVAVYAGPGARGVGMFRWTQLMDQAPEMQATYVDGPSIRAGALREIDLLVMPGGMSNVEEDNLGLEGQQEVRRFIEEGGSYVGTCAGAFLMLERAKERPLGIVPFSSRRGCWGGEAMLQVNYTKEAQDLYGIKSGLRMERFNGGPVMVPSNPIKGADFKVMAEFHSNLHSFSTKKKFPTADGNLPSMAGAASAVAGTFGKGRVWLFAGHPEYYPDTWKSVRDAIRFATGRTVTLQAPQRRRGQLSVGWWCKPGLGAATADVARSLVRDRDFDVTPYSTDEIYRTDLRHEDAIVVPDAADEGVVKKQLGPVSGSMKAFVAFMNRGGTVVTWGAAAKYFKPHKNLRIVEKGTAVAGALRALKQSPRPAPRKGPAPKNKNAVRVAAYYDSGASGFSAVQWIKLLSLSPDCIFQPVDAEDVRKGALANADLYIAPGGSSAEQSATLQPQGRTNLVEFVRNGGTYFGTCAGCYLAHARRPNGNAKYAPLGLVPYRGQRSPYRGGSLLEIRFTDNADLFGFKANTERTVRYHGGPVLEACEMIPGADIKEIATYACEGVYAFNTNSAPTMLGHPAIVAGTFGKGRVVACSPHPESFVHTQDIIRGGLKYLTGRDFASEYPQHTRGNLVVGFRGSCLHRDGAQLAADLFREPTLDVRAVDGDTIGCGDLEHCDALVMVHLRRVSPFVCAFTRRGGSVFASGTEEQCAALRKQVKAQKLNNVHIFTTTEALKQALVEFSNQPVKEN
ncbi:MAG: BPL-N domain-containing protein [Kiritimatiellae bacterium]|nr:BPL-N domain-containing protein [Kiritimatiellia bacterium]